MATEPEPNPELNLEAQLRAYAELRRKEAMPPLEMHPATRRLLQGEVTRTYGGSATEAAPRKNWFAAFWPRLTVGGAVCAALAWLLVSVQTERRGETASGRAGESTMSPRLRVSASPLDAASGAASPAPAPDKSQIGNRKSEIAGLAESQGAPMETGKNVLVPLPAASVPEQPALGRRLERESVDAFKRDADRGAVPAEPPMKEEAAVRRLAELERRSGSLPPSRRGETAGGRTGESATLPRPGVSASPLDTASGVASPASAPAPAESKSPIANRQSPIAGAETAAPRRADQVNAERAMLKESKVATAQRRAGEPETGTVSLSRRVTDSASQPGGAGPAVAFTSTANLQGAAGAKDKALPGQRFKQLDAGYRQNFNSPPPSRVLTSFQMEQAGQQVRITDADGSTYLGELTLTERRTDETANGRMGERARVAVSPSRRLPVSPPSGVDRPGAEVYVLPAGQTLNFRAVGTNRSLNQAVVIDGAFLNYGNASVGGVGNRKSEIVDRKSQGYQQLPLNQLRIQGRAVIGGNSEIPIDAVPAKP